MAGSGVVVLAGVAPEVVGSMGIQSVEQLRTALQSTLDAIPEGKCIGAFAFGACMDDDFNPKQGFEIGFFLHSLNPKELPDFAPIIKAFGKANSSLGFLFTPDMVHSASDTYPLEFLNLANRHAVLHGEFPLQGFMPHPMALRHQCERELRGLLIHLHREFAIHSGSPKELRAMLQYTLPRFQPVFRGIYWLLNQFQYPSSTAECLMFIDSYWQLGNLFPRVSTPPKDSQEVQWLAGDYILSIEKILKTIDHLEVQP